MDLFDALKGALRRWYVLIPILVLTAVLAIVVNNRKTTEYTASAIIGVTSSTAQTSLPAATTSTAPTASAGNNQLITNGGLTLVTNLLTIGLQNEAVSQAVAEANGTADYTVEVLQRGSAGLQLPIVTITARGPAAEPVSATMRVLVGQANAVLANIQQSAGVVESRYARTFVVDPVSAPTRSILSTARNVGTVIAAGIVVAFVVAAIVDNLVNRRRVRRRRSRTSGRPQHAAGDTAPAEPADTADAAETAETTEGAEPASRA